jgi:hypothetical protein
MLVRTLLVTVAVTVVVLVRMCVRLGGGHVVVCAFAARLRRIE